MRNPQTTKGYPLNPEWQARRESHDTVAEIASDAGGSTAYVSRRTNTPKSKPVKKWTRKSVVESNAHIPAISMMFGKISGFQWVDHG